MGHAVVRQVNGVPAVIGGGTAVPVGAAEGHRDAGEALGGQPQRQQQEDNAFHYNGHGRQYTAASK